MLQKKYIVLLSAFGLLFICIGYSMALFGGDDGNDWPMWRYDANRSAASPNKLSDDLHLQWVRDYPALTPAWENPLNRDLMQFDKVYEPVVQGKNLFVGSNANDRMIALDTDTGEEKWSFHVGGPVRFPPIAHNGNVYFVSDDGHLYCLDGEKGTLVWKFRGGPGDRKILGNERIVSTWPARGGPVLKDGVIYFGAGIWPFMGIFIYALDAETGKVIWENDGTGPIYMKQPHNSPSYAGIAPQGSLVVSGDKLLIPCGRSMPACLDRHTGEFLYYRLSDYNKTGGAFVSALDKYFVNYHRNYVTSLYDISNGNRIISQFGNIPVMTKNTLYSMGGSITAYDLGNLRQEEQKSDRLVVNKSDKKVQVVRDKNWVLDKRWTASVNASGDLIKAGNRLYAGGSNIVTAVSIPRFWSEPKVKWTAKIEGTAARLIVADDKLFAVTLGGRIYAFGRKKIKPVFHSYAAEKVKLPKNAVAKAAYILKTTGIREGYCIAYGLKNGNMVEALAKNSDLRIIAIDPDPDKVDKLRRRLVKRGLYGKKITIQVGDPFKLEMPPYLASLTVFEDLEAAKQQRGKEFFEKVYHSIRPYGGVACFPVSGGKMADMMNQIENLKLPQAKIRRINRATQGLQFGGHILLTRKGPLPGSADWTHQYGDIANTVKSDDKLVKLPLGVLWFGGSSNTDVLPRHGHGPPEQVIDGKLFIEGIDSFSARDVYTGRILWKRSISNLDTFNVYYDSTYKDTPLDPSYNQVHIPGANARGTNYVATKDKLYIAKKNTCLVLDPATGKTIDEFKLPTDPRTSLPANWGYIGVYKDYLIAGAGFVHYLDFVELDEIGAANVSSKRMPFYNFDITSSKKLMVMNRHTGEVLWSRNSELGFRHNAIIAGEDKIFCIDTLPIPVLDALKRRLGEYHYGKSTLMALNVKTGKPVWSTKKKVFGTWLGYSDEHGILIQSGRKSRDMMRGEPSKGMTAYKARGGKVLWSNDASQNGPYILHGDKIITERYSYSLLTGKQITRQDPLTGEDVLWAFRRNYGCNYPVASEHLLTFRSAAAGFFDLANDGGTGNFGGFKSSCTSNLIVANGVLNAPDYTRTCSCSYQNQSSLAMVHMPDMEIWTDYHSEGRSAVIAGSSSAIMFADLNGELTYANKAFLNMFGYTESEILGKSALELIQTGQEAQEAVEALLSDGKWKGKLVALKKKGTTFDILLSASVATDETGNPKSIMASALNIASDAVVFFDLDWQLTHVNSTFLSLLGYSSDDEVLGKKITDFWPDEEDVQEMQEVLLSKGKWKGELVALKKDGLMIDIYLLAGMVLDEDGEPVSMTCSVVDLTEYRKVKKAANRLNSVMRASRDIKQAITDDKPIKSIGINLGAPGDRRADNGVLWLEYPIVGGPSPSISVTIDSEKPLFRLFDYSFQADLDKNKIPAKLKREFISKGISIIPAATVSVQKKGSRWAMAASRRRTYIIDRDGYWLNVYGYEQFSHHSSRIEGEGPKWVVASGIKKASAIKVSLARRPSVANGNENGSLLEPFIKERPYTVRLYFSEPEDIKAGERTFNVAIQGQEVLKGFDIVKAAGSHNHPVVKEFKGINVKWDLEIALKPSANSANDPLICGIEVSAEGW